MSGSGSNGRPRVLVVDDDASITAFLKRALAYEGYQVETAADGQTALATARDNPPDLVILDIMLPGLDGVEVLRRLRAGERDTGSLPILMLTARDEVSDRVAGLDAGADDYVTKPFAFAELLSRLRALIRRGRPPRPTALTRGQLTLDPATRMVTWAGTPIELTSREFALLEYLMHHAGEVVQRSTIRRHVWGANSDERSSNTIDAYVKNLRDKIDRRFDAEVIETIRGVGYRLRPLSAE